ncbi:ABC-type transport system involved in resistance to organic solvents, periplasmic component [Candidatus Protofrankia californiensis]|uniref:ABC-type transport system involved in resistance to organic solvents, periplasmic component n=1 Tax=Candidatus Protofrankia californiensis TaxID=1839754 RepID=A0A1C3NZ25_9ACTN|nr:ABC-type transport system involved in resistance to organic solvents, periplasmic component [Candidatus Protofrankia californiensis]
MAGVKAGKVDTLSVDGDEADIVMQLHSAFPLHRGAVVQVREKTLVNETFLEIEDGSGPVLPSGAQLPRDAGKPATELDDVLASLDEDTRESLASGVRSLGTSTDGGKQSISQALQGLGDLGREGRTALDALAAQSKDLEQVTGSTATLLAALNTRQGQIGQLVEDANLLAQSTSDNRGPVEEIVRKLPGLLDTTRNATTGLRNVSAALSPVATNLDAAAPDLSAALTELPQTSADLRGLLPSLDGVLTAAPDTLTRVPAVADDLNALIPSLRVDLSDLNPMLGYLQPYGHDIAAFFTNWAQAAATGDVNGRMLRIFVAVNEQSVKGLPLNTNIGPLNKFNPYPLPGSGVNPGPASNPYPRVMPEPR